MTIYVVFLLSDMFYMLMSSSICAVLFYIICICVCVSIIVCDVYIYLCIVYNIVYILLLYVI